MRTCTLCLVLGLVCVMPSAAQVDFTSSNLPIVLIDTEEAPIPDEPKITARMGIIDNGAGQRNQVDDPFNGYDGLIGIEIRGASSQMFPKKQYAVETRHADGSNRNVPLLGLPEENDWVLYAPYSDKSLLRNVLTYYVARRMGRYASRTRFVELVLNGEYQGVYVLMEKIKRDKGRVDIATLNPDEITGDDLTGGYIVKIDKWVGGEQGGWASPHPPRSASGRTVTYQYHDPSPSELVPEQKAYIRNTITAFEDLMAGSDYADPVVGYPAVIDVGSFVDFFLVNELGRNVDGYRLSTFLYKDKDSNGGKLMMGPVWDFNLAFGNADYYNGSATEGFQVDFAVSSDQFHLPFWWSKLLQDATFRRAIAERWTTLRRGVLHLDSLTAFVDQAVAQLDEAQERNFQRWPVLNQYVWPNDYIGGTYEREVNYLKSWIRQRVAWLDAQISQDEVLWTEEPNPQPTGTVELSHVHPNPASTQARFTLTLPAAQPVTIEVVDVLGRRRAVLHDGLLAAGVLHTFHLDATMLPAGVYLIRLTGTRFTATRTAVLVR